MRDKVRWIVRVQLLCSLLLALCPGCSSPSYLGNRARDAADIFTATVGLNYGAKARIGPLRAGLFGGQDYAGLRAGEVGLPFHLNGYEQAIDLEMTAMSSETFFPESLRIAKERGKCFTSEGIICFALPDQSENASRRQQAAYYSQTEIAVGVFGGVRLGFNLGELLDFILGWTTLDIYDDDLKQTEANMKLAGSCSTRFYPPCHPDFNSPR
jgi:hypothetical protein